MNYGIGGTRIARQSKQSAEERWDKDFCSRVATIQDEADAVVVFGGTNDYGHGDTPLHRLNENSPLGDGYKETEVWPLSFFVKIIRKVTEYYSLPVLDLYATSGLQPEVPIIKERYMPDGLHPNDAGHIILADKIGKFLENL